MTVWSTFDYRTLFLSTTECGERMIQKLCDNYRTGNPLKG
jgi:hypothetical protein